MPFKWTLNPYRGCTHGCHYCYARRYHTQFELGADDEFASVIFVKTNVVETLRRELQRPQWTNEVVALGKRRQGLRIADIDRRELAECGRANQVAQLLDRREESLLEPVITMRPALALAA